MPQSRNTRIRAKDTSRVEARRRHRDEVRATAGEPVEPPDLEETPAAAPTRSALSMPDIRTDLAALPGMFRRPLLWLPFGLLLAAFVLVLLIAGESLPEDTVSELAELYVSLTLPPTSLFIFFIGGFLAPRGSYLVGGLLGAFDALLITLLYVVAPSMAANEQLREAGLTGAQGEGSQLTMDVLLPLWAIAIFVGVLAASFASWYRRFLRSSQERARANRAARERDQAQKAKSQARADKQAAREVRRTR